MRYLKPTQQPQSVTSSMLTRQRLTKQQQRLIEKFDTDTGMPSAQASGKPGFVYGAHTLAKAIDASKQRTQKVGMEPDSPRLYSDPSADDMLEGGDADKLALQKEYSVDELNEFKVKRFAREQRGKFVLIFPFNKRTEELAIELNRTASLNSGTGHCSGVGGPNLVKQILKETKNYYDERQKFFFGQ